MKVIGCDGPEEQTTTRGLAASFNSGRQIIINIGGSGFYLLDCLDVTLAFYVLKEKMVHSNEGC